MLSLEVCAPCNFQHAFNPLAIQVGWARQGGDPPCARWARARHLGASLNDRVGGGCLASAAEVVRSHSEEDFGGNGVCARGSGERACSHSAGAR